MNNILQVQSCAENALRCQATARLLLAPLVISSAGVARFQPRSRRVLQQQQSRSIHRFPGSNSSAQPTRLFLSTRPRYSILSSILANARFQSTSAPAPAKPAATASSSPEPTIHPVFEPRTGTFQYVVADPATNQAVIIDPVLDYDKCTRVITTTSADALLALVREKGYTVARILETHAHADHLTASFYLQRRLTEQQGAQQKPPVCIGKRIGQVQSLFGARYGIDAAEYEGVFDELLADDEEFSVGTLTAQAMHLPGHTPDHMGYRIGDNIFCGDSLFNPDIGTARCDFPGGSANALYKSAQKVLSLPPHVRIWTGHDYPPADDEGKGATRDPVPAVSVAEHRRENRHLKDGVTEDQFVAMRRERDAHLAAPRLLHESLQVNVRAGRLPAANEVGMRLLHVPLQVKGPNWQ